MTGYTINSGQQTQKWPQYVAALAATGGALAAGTALGWTSPAGPQLGVNGTDDTYDFKLDDSEVAWVGSSLNLGAAAVCIPIGALMNIIGRKWSMLSLVIPFTIGWGLIIWAQNLAMLIVGRVLLGIASGAFCVTSPAYIGEIAQKEIRGTLGSYFQLMITIGILFVYCIGAGVNLLWLSIICGIIPLIFGAVFFLMPESPSYLVMRDRNQEAHDAIHWFRGKLYDPTEDIAELQNENEEQKANNLSLMQALGRTASRRGFMMALGLMFFQQMSGINAVIFYTAAIFGYADTGIDPLLATIIVGVMQVVTTFIASLVVDKLGRRLLLLLSDAVMAICTILLGIYFYLQTNDHDVSSLGWLPVFSLCLFIVAFSFGFGPVPWLMTGELFASDVKTILAPICGTFNWLLAFVITLTFSSLTASLGLAGTFWLFSGLSILGTVFVFLVIPETKGKSLNEIQKMLAGEKETTVSVENEEDK